MNIENRSGWVGERLYTDVCSRTGEGEVRPREEGEERGRGCEFYTPGGGVVGQPYFAG